MTPIVLTRADADAATCQALTDLCLRSKALWGYDAAFLEACRAPLTVTPGSFENIIAVFRDQGVFTGFLQLSVRDQPAEISKLFICPRHAGHGLGSALITFAKAKARTAGVTALMVESDPQAVPFYHKHGGEMVGEVASEAIPGRKLPLLRIPT